MSPATYCRESILRAEKIISFNTLCLPPFFTPVQSGRQELAGINSDVQVLLYSSVIFLSSLFVISWSRFRKDLG